MSVSNENMRQIKDHNSEMILSKNKLLFTNSKTFARYGRQLLKASSSSPKWENTNNLPQLPVPKLSQTLDKYLKSVQPFLNETEFKRTKCLLDEFQAGIGTKLQRLLVEKAKVTENWLSDWWLNVAYLEYRDPVVVYSSPGQVFPCEDFKEEKDRLEYTAKLILAALDYKFLIESGKMPLDKMGKDVLDMNQYKKIFGTCRIPGTKRDTLEFNSHSRHIIVTRNNNYFKLQVINSEGKVPSKLELISDLQEIIEDSEECGPAIGILTTENRNTWGNVYEDLMKDPLNCNSVSDIQKSLFLVCLDNPMPKFSGNYMTVAGHQTIHGGGSRGNAANRWFDKTVQFVVGIDGIVGLTYEHSPSEGQPIAVMTDYLVDYIKSGKADTLPDTKFECEPQKLEFCVYPKLQEAIHQANINLDKLVSNLEMDCFKFGEFGKEFIKSQKLSPDSFLQMAMQLAFYRIHKVPGAHYESAATRKYIHGRTETIRSCSVESINFAKTMLDSSKSNDQKLDALRQAIQAHKTYSVEAVNGFGVDRHLLGLKLIAIENGFEIPEIYKDVSFSRSTHMRLSTSQVATKCDGFMCYGPLVSNGYGCCYNPRANDINFGCSAFNESDETSAKEYSKALGQSLMDMHNVVARTQRSKL